MLEDLKKLALEAIRIKTRIKADTEKLQEIKNQVVEKSKDRNSSYTIKVDDGSIRIIKYKRLIYFKLNQRGFDKLDNDTKNNLLKNKLVKIKFSVNYDGYEEASNKNSVPNNLKELVDQKERKPFSVSVLLNKEEEIAFTKIEEKIILDGFDDDDPVIQADAEALEDLYLNVFPPDLQSFTDDAPEDLTEVEKQDLGISDNERLNELPENNDEEKIEEEKHFAEKDREERLKEKKFDLIQLKKEQLNKIKNETDKLEKEIKEEEEKIRKNYADNLDDEIPF